MNTYNSDASSLFPQDRSKANKGDQRQNLVLDSSNKPRKRSMIGSKSSSSFNLEQFLNKPIAEEKPSGVLLGENGNSVKSSVRSSGHNISVINYNNPTINMNFNERHLKGPVKDPKKVLSRRDSHNSRVKEAIGKNDDSVGERLESISLDKLDLENKAKDEDVPQDLQNQLNFSKFVNAPAMPGGSQQFDVQNV